MDDAIFWASDAINSVEWASVAAVATAIIAFSALQSWKRQEKAKREIEFLYGMLDAAHAYISEMSKPLMILMYAKIGMESHAPIGEYKDATAKAAKGAVPFIKSDGGREGQRLTEALEAVQPSVITLRSLQSKGQVFDFGGYSKTAHAIAMLTWQFDRLEGLAYLLSSSSLNFENPQVQATLQGFVPMTPEDVKKSMGENEVILLTFTRSVYRKHYGGQLFSKAWRLVRKLRRKAPAG